MKLHSLKPAEGSVKNKKRIGRGQGSGRGGTSTRGHNGAKSRSGYSQKLGFEGGQMPLQRRIPKFGFTNPSRIEYKVINLDTLQSILDSDNVDKVDLVYLKQHGYATKNDRIKVLGRGELKGNVEVEVHAFSASAIEAIEKAGGKATKL
ncbi:MAG: 50S ribosomal protein L15 [Cyclobacteriaceae bacterium]